MNTPTVVERVNGALMVAACAAAFVAPFHLFLAAYAILGPLHYLTQISWLHDRHYFAPRPAARRWWLVLVGAAMVVLLYGYVSNDLMRKPVKPTLEIAMVYLVFATAAFLRFPGRVFEFLGNISFSIYMLHELAIQLVLKLGWTSNALLYGASTTLTVAAATVCYLAVERPFLRLKTRFAALP